MMPLKAVPQFGGRHYGIRLLKSLQNRRRMPSPQGIRGRTGSWETFDEHRDCGTGRHRASPCVGSPRRCRHRPCRPHHHLRQARPRRAPGSQRADRRRHRAAGPPDTAIQFYTSGTTGLRKGAELTNANFAWMFPLWTKTWLLAPGVPNLVCLPMFHIGGAGWGIAGLFAGATNHVVREFVPAEILQIVERQRLQVMLLVPALILFLVQAPQIRQTDLSSLRLIVYGAAPIPAALLKQAMGIFPCGFQQVYGLTETTGAITLLPPDDHDPTDARKLLSCGYAQTGVELRIVGDDGRDLPTGEVGEIAVRSPPIMRGYWRLAQATPRSIQADWCLTGD